MKILHSIILLFIASILLSSCVGQPQRPYYFPVMDLKLERYFENELQSKKQIGDYEYYQRSRELLLQSGYFKRLSTHSPYLMAIEYNQFIHTSVLEVVGKALNPINAIFGIDVECSVVMQVTISHRDKVIERYKYRKEFKSGLDAIKNKNRHYFDDFMQRLIEDMLKQSKIKRKSI
ncbi:MAG: hypothetical protein JXQ76_09345 [Campylobacterales bacterium]|nr:hypothetical protein [Campylobacterales bacterium]